MITKYTPGPWRIIDGYNIYTELGGQSGDGTQADSRDGWHIASIGDTPTFVGSDEVVLGRELKRSNARLIAAAPDLLEALEGMIEVFGVYDQHLYREPFSRSVEVELCNQARAAIAKARGES